MAHKLEHGIRVAFTGHRLNKVADFEVPVKDFMIETFEALFNRLEDPDGVILEIISGMAVGVDQWAGEFALYLKDQSKWDHVILHASLPMERAVQTKYWKTPQIDTYDKLLAGANIVTQVDLGQEDAKLGAKYWNRNVAMVNGSDFLFAVYDGSAGGTSNCVGYACKIGHPVLIYNYRLATFTWVNKEALVLPGKKSA
jgi:uncharacterized phage-like protein YoqJ